MRLTLPARVSRCVFARRLIGGLPGGFSYLHPPVSEVARALQINLCHAALVDAGDVNGVMADADSLGLALNATGGDSTFASAPPPLPPLQNGGAPPPLPPIGAPHHRLLRL